MKSRVIRDLGTAPKIWYYGVLPALIYPHWNQSTQFQQKKNWDNSSPKLSTQTLYLECDVDHVIQLQLFLAVVRVTNVRPAAKRGRAVLQRDHALDRLTGAFNCRHHVKTFWKERREWLRFNSLSFKITFLEIQYTIHYEFHHRL